MNFEDKLFDSYKEIAFADAKNADLKRENANINGDTSMGQMLRFGSEGAKEFYLNALIPAEFSKAHRDGDIHIHDLDFYGMTTTCTQINLKKVLASGFSTGHGFIRPPKSIKTAANLACIIIQSNQNDQHGGQSIADFDYGLAPYVALTFKSYLKDYFHQCWQFSFNEDCKINGYKLDEMIEKTNPSIGDTAEWTDEMITLMESNGIPKSMSRDFLSKIYSLAINKTDEECYQAMEALVHNLNTMHSRAGSQVPFSSINYGMDTSYEGKMVIKNVLLAHEAGLGCGETPLFPIHIFRVKKGVNAYEGEPNYPLFKLALRVSAKRMFPNFSFIDAPFNLMYYKGTPETEVGYMGCRTRVLGNVCGDSQTYGRGNLSFTSINLPRLALIAAEEAEGNEEDVIDYFFDLLYDEMDLVARQLKERYRVQCSRLKKNFPFLMSGIWKGSENLKENDTLESVLKEGTLSIGFIGLAETLITLIGKHHGESEEAQKLGLEIIDYMRDFVSDRSQDEKLNYTLLATPAEGLSGRFVKLDRERFGVIKDVTDREYYTNSFHVPVWYHINAFNKIKIEAPYHTLTNAGHISYIELDGDPTTNLDALEKVVHCMMDSGIGYGAINHPIDSDPACGYHGIIDGDVCPKCGRKETKEEPFERLRRITGYLVGTLDRWNNAKKAEEADRVKHM